MKNLLFMGLGFFVAFLSFVLPNFSFAQKVETPKDVGISFSNDCLTGFGMNCFSYEKTVGIEKDQKVNYTAMSIVQDVIFSATYILGTVLTIVLIYCGLMYIFAARGGKDPSKYRKGLINAAIGSVLVRGAYAIIRLIQYVAKG